MRLLFFLFLAAAAASARLQQQHHSRSLINICIGVEVGLVVDLLALLGLKADLCLCLHDLDLFLETDVRAFALIDKLGSYAAARAHLETLFHQHGRPCDALPSHAHRPRFCSGDPCAIECDPGFQLRNGQCVCPYGTIECNGQCGYYPKGCASAAAIHRAKRDIESPITSLSQAQSTCRHGEIVCGVPGSSTAFECLDVSNQLDSCGGCVTNHPFRSPASPVGHDCNDLIRRHALEVSCQVGQCVVHSCRAGFKPNEKATDCVSTSSTISQDANPTSIPALISANLQSVMAIRAAVASVASVSGQHAHVTSLLEVTAQISLVALHAVHRPILANDMMKLVAELDIRTVAAFNAPGITSAQVIPLNQLDASIDVLLQSLLDLTTALTECHCHDDQQLLEAINIHVVGASSFNDIAFQLTRRQYPPRDFEESLINKRQDQPTDPATGGPSVSAKRHYPTAKHISSSKNRPRRQYPPFIPTIVEERGLESVTTFDLDSVIDLSDPTIAASLRSYAALLGLAYSLRSESYSISSSSTHGSFAEHSATILHLSNTLVSTISTQPLCLEPAVDTSKQLLAVTETCLGLSGIDTETQASLTSIYGLSLQLWVSCEKALDDLEQCGCEHDERFLSGTATISTSLTLDLDLDTSTTTTQSDTDLEIDVSYDSDITAILDYTQTLLDLQTTLDLNAQSLLDSCGCLSTSSPLTDCVVMVSNLTAAIADLELCDYSNLDSLPPLLYELDALLGSCVWSDGTVNGTETGFDYLLQANYDLLLTTENLLDRLDSCGCKDDKKLVSGAKKLAANRKGRRTLASR